jgi:hypothetical protein
MEHISGAAPDACPLVRRQMIKAMMLLERQILDAVGHFGGLVDFRDQLQVGDALSDGDALAGARK